MEKKLKNLKIKIQDYINNGGNIHDSRRNLPYYYDMKNIIDYCRKKLGKEITYQQLYELCGFERDYEYHNFKQFCADLKANTHLFLNAEHIKNKESKESNNIYVRLKSYAEKYNTNPYDFLVLMTGFRMNECYIKTDHYQEILRREIFKAYPTGNITGIRRQHPDLYEKLNHLKKYMNITMPEVLAMLGLTTNRSKSVSNTILNEQDIIKELREMYPNGNIINLATQNVSLYRKTIALCVKEKKSTNEWCQENNFTYKQAKNVNRLGSISVNAKQRYDLLIKLKGKMYEKYTIKSTNEKDLYHTSLQASLEVIDFLNKHPLIQSVEDLDAYYLSKQM